MFHYYSVIDGTMTTLETILKKGIDPIIDEYFKKCGADGRDDRWPSQMDSS
ncbi:MAG: hypothetical protein IH630_05335 [Thermoplasmata archaeon]|nr:hypothetical protein [Thermoplasmata archaeon]